MAQRFTSTEKWGDPWFRDLEPAAKLGYLYLIDRCDHAGIIDLDTKLAEFCIGCEVPWNDLIGSDRIHHIEGTKYWLVKFCQFQYRKGLNTDSQVHASVLSLLEKHNLTSRLPQGFINPSPRVKDKDKAKDKAKVDRGSAEGEELSRIESSEVREAAEMWVGYKAEKRQRYKPQGLKALVTTIIAKASEQGDSATVADIVGSMGDNYQGIVWGKYCARGSPAKPPRPSVDFEELASRGEQ